MKSILKSLFFIAIILPHGEDHDHSHDKTGNIFGYVYDQDSDKPLELVSISVFDINQDLVTGGVSDKDGFFNIERIFTGTLAEPSRPLSCNLWHIWSNSFVGNL